MSRRAEELGAAPQDQRETAPSASLHGSSRAAFEMMLTKAKEGQGKHECGRLGPNQGMAAVGHTIDLFLIL